MNKILIISPHFPPSNLTAVHRARFFANHLPQMGWEPIILTVHEDFYEEEPDWNLHKLLPDGLRIEKVKAFKISKPRLIGDIGLRAFFPMYKRAKALIQKEKIDFVYITIPSFYGALWGRWLHEKTGVPYGIDYIDPWVHVFPGSEKLFSRHWFATKVSGWLEPIAVKKASLISGVAASYFEGVIERNPKLIDNCRFVAIPFGSEQSDHEAVAAMGLQPYLFEKKEDKIQLVYAGAMLPKAYTILNQILLAIAKEKQAFENLEIHFIGTGKSPTDKNGYNVRDMAKQHGLWKKNIFEYPARIPYLDVLVHLSSATGAFILGSTEPHYTPSKVYQAVLSKKAILAVLHEKSTAVSVIRDSKAGIVWDFRNEEEANQIDDSFVKLFQEYRKFLVNYNFDLVDKSPFQQYSANHVTSCLRAQIECIVE